MKPIDYFSEKYYALLDGTITDLHVGSDKTELLAKVNEYYIDKTAILSVAESYCASPCGSFLSMHYNGSTEHFICMLDGHVICGQFSGVAMLPEGAYVKMAVKLKNNLLIAEGVLFPRRGWCWLGYTDDNVVHDSKISRMISKIPLWVWGVLAPLIMMPLSIALIIGETLSYILSLIWPTNSSERMTIPIRQIMTLFNFDKLDSVDLHDFSYFSSPFNCNIDDEFGCNVGSVYVYQRALESSELSLVDQPAAQIPELNQRKVEGVIRDLNTHPPEHYFKDDGWLEDDLMTFSTWMGASTFKCYIGDQPVCGSFCGAERLREGDYVTAAVYDRYDITIATGILSDTQGLLWAIHPRGPIAERRHRYKGYGIFVLAIWCVMSLFGAIFTLLGAPPNVFWGFSVMGVTVGLLYARKWLKLKPRTQEDIWYAPIMGRAMIVLGFARPFSIHLTEQYCVNTETTDLLFTNVYYYKKAIADGKLKLNKP